VVRARRALPHNLIGLVDLETGLLQVLHDALGELVTGRGERALPTALVGLRANLFPVDGCPYAGAS
jgi:hypothetical protein